MAQDIFDLIDAPAEQKSFNTPVPFERVPEFEQWVKRYAPAQDSGDDYDYGGAFLAGITPNAEGHWPDRFKKPNHPTFSDESQYAKDAPNRAGHWNGEQYVAPKGDIFDLVATERPSALGADELQQASDQQDLERTFKAPDWANRAATAALNTARGFIPTSLHDVAGLATPVTGAVDEMIKDYRIGRDVLTTPASIEEASRKYAPERFQLVDAEKTPPLSQERFQAASDTLAQMLMAAAISKGLKGGEVPKPTAVRPDEVGQVPVPSQESVRTEPVLSPEALSRVRGADIPAAPLPTPSLEAIPTEFSRFEPTPPEPIPSRETSSVPLPTEERPATPISREAEKEAASESVDISGQNKPEPTSTSERVSDDPFVSRIANRFTEERAARGEIGEIAPGEGYATSDLVSRGLRMPPEEVAQHVSDVMNDGGNDPVAQAAAIRAEEARLSDRSTEAARVAQANPTDLTAQHAADSAFQDLTDFHKGPIAKLKQRFHATGMALQGEIPVDLSTFNGLREAWLKDTGKAPPPTMEPTFKRVASNVTRAMADERLATNRLGEAIDRATRGRKLPSPEEVRNSIVERMKDAPCRV